MALRLETAEQLPGNSDFIFGFATGLLSKLSWQVKGARCSGVFFLVLLILCILEWFLKLQRLQPRTPKTSSYFLPPNLVVVIEISLGLERSHLCDFVPFFFLLSKSKCFSEEWTRIFS